jgi:hypothetical protein
MVQKTHMMTLTVGLKMATLMEICWWAVKAWLSVSQGVTGKGFEVTDISNKMNRSEDDFLWHWSDEERCQEDATDSEEV